MELEFAASLSLAMGIIYLFTQRRVGIDNNDCDCYGVAGRQGSDLSRTNM